jgi:hypothetical protein
LRQVDTLLAAFGFHYASVSAKACAVVMASKAAVMSAVKNGRMIAPW